MLIEILCIGAAIAGVGAIIYIYLSCSVKERLINGGTFYSKEVQDQYGSLTKHYTPLFKTVKEIKGSYNKKCFSIMSLFYDNPMWLVDGNKARSTIGFLISEEIKETDKEKLTVGMNVNDIPSFKAMTIPMFRYGMKLLYPAYMIILMKAYFKKYCAEMIDRNEQHAVIVETMRADGYCLLIPLPSELKHFKLSKFPEPELNAEGKKHVTAHIKTTSEDGSKAKNE